MDSDVQMHECIVLGFKEKKVWNEKVSSECCDHQSSLNQRKISVPYSVLWAWCIFPCKIEQDPRA
jgi:hypothetical protein